MAKRMDQFQEKGIFKNCIKSNQMNFCIDRYFTCPMKYGLFAPPYKVVRGTPLRTITRTRVDSGPKVHF